MSADAIPAVRKWVARNDWATVEILLSSEQQAPSDIICFHCQQYLEKLLKALLTQENQEAPKTHDLRRLVDLAVKNAPVLADWFDRVDVLTAYAVEARYPDDWRAIDRQEVTRSVDLCRELGAIIETKLRS